MSTKNSNKNHNKDRCTHCGKKLGIVRIRTGDVVKCQWYCSFCSFEGDFWEENCKVERGDEKSSTK